MALTGEWSEALFPVEFPVPCQAIPQAPVPGLGSFPDLFREPVSHLVFWVYRFSSSTEKKVFGCFVYRTVIRKLDVDIGFGITGSVQRLHNYNPPDNSENRTPARNTSPVTIVIAINMEIVR